MADSVAEMDNSELKRLIKAAVAQIDADATRLGRALGAVPAGTPDGVTLDVFAAIATARRSAYTWFGRIRNLDTNDPAKAEALGALSTVAAALGSWYRALRTTDTTIRRREERQAKERFATATRLFERLDTTLEGTP